MGNFRRGRDLYRGYWWIKKWWRFYEGVEQFSQIFWKKWYSSPISTPRFRSSHRKNKIIPKIHKDVVGTGLDGMQRSHNVKCTLKSLLIWRFFEVVDNLIPDYYISFNKKNIDIVETTKYLQPFDSFKSFGKNYLNVLHNNYLVDFPEHNNKKLLLNEHTHYNKGLYESLRKRNLKRWHLQILSCGLTS